MSSNSKIAITRSVTSAVVAVGTSAGMEKIAQKHTDIDTRSMKFRMSSGAASAVVAFKTAPYTDTIIEVVAARLAARKERRQQKKTAKKEQ